MNKRTILCKLSWWCERRHDHTYYINIELSDEKRRMMQEAMKEHMPDIEERMKKYAKDLYNDIHND